MKRLLFLLLMAAGSGSALGTENEKVVLLDRAENQVNNAYQTYLFEQTEYDYVQLYKAFKAQQGLNITQFLTWALPQNNMQQAKNCAQKDLERYKETAGKPSFNCSLSFDGKAPNRWVIQKSIILQELPILTTLSDFIFYPQLHENTQFYEDSDWMKDKKLYHVKYNPENKTWTVIEGEFGESYQAFHEPMAIIVNNSVTLESIQKELEQLMSNMKKNFNSGQYKKQLAVVGSTKKGKAEYFWLQIKKQKLPEGWFKLIITDYDRIEYMLREINTSNFSQAILKPLKKLEENRKAAAELNQLEQQKNNNQADNGKQEESDSEEEKQPTNQQPNSEDKEEMQPSEQNQNPTAQGDQENVAENEEVVQQPEQNPQPQPSTSWFSKATSWVRNHPYATTFGITATVGAAYLGYRLYQR